MGIEIGEECFDQSLPTLISFEKGIGIGGAKMLSSVLHGDRDELFPFHLFQRIVDDLLVEAETPLQRADGRFAEGEEGEIEIRFSFRVSEFDESTLHKVVKNS